ncbi:hypothetical protein Bca101_074900 [Brassica carinata]
MVVLVCFSLSTEANPCLSPLLHFVEITASLYLLSTTPPVISSSVDDRMKDLAGNVNGVARSQMQKRFHANRMLSFYAPGWCGEVRDVIFSENNVTVVYRLTIRGSDGEAHRESTGTVTITDDVIEDPVAAAEEIAFCRACARFGLGLYLYHEE